MEVLGRGPRLSQRIIQTGEGAERGEDIEMSGATAADQDFMVASRQDIPRLITEVRRLRALLDKAG